jgi:lipoprotein-anchoring transpeptidase ErfK/SrfK
MGLKSLTVTQKLSFSRRWTLKSPMKNALRCFRCGVSILFLSLGLWSCGLLTPPPKVSLPPQAAPVVREAPQPPSAAALLTAEEEAAARTQAVLDIPPPIPILPPLKATPLPAPEAVKIVIKKNERKLLLYEKGELRKMFPVDLGKNPSGPKIYQGDMRTPEGEYFIVEKRDIGQTKFYLALVLNYPNDRDRQRYDWAVKKGYLPKDVGIGGMIEIHGEGIGFDWTQGCIALDNPHMQELFRKIPVGTAVHIEP